MSFGYFLTDIFFATVRIMTLEESGVEASIGTGFIFYVETNNPEHKTALLLISNRHVFGGPNRRIILNFTKAIDDRSAPNYGEIVTFDEIYGDGYIEHPDDNVDLAGLIISNIMDSGTDVFYRCMKTEIISDLSEPELYPGKEIWFVGYPHGLFDERHNLPILRRGYIASLPNIDFNGQKVFLVDAQVFPGSSGSPVFVNYGTNFKLAGVITETMVKYEELVTMPSVLANPPENYAVQQILGLGVVIKTHALKELLDHTVSIINQRSAAA
jgi:hypothetical protein